MRCVYAFRPSAKTALQSVFLRFIGHQWAWSSRKGAEGCVLNSIAPALDFFFFAVLDDLLILKTFYRHDPVPPDLTEPGEAPPLVTATTNRVSLLRSFSSIIS